MATMEWKKRRFTVALELVVPENEEGWSPVQGDNVAQALVDQFLDVVDATKFKRSCWIAKACDHGKEENS